MIRKHVLMRGLFCLTLLTGFLIAGCKTYSAEEKKYIAQIEEQRKQKDREMKDDPASPFRRDPAAHYAPLKYYPVDPAYVFHSRLTRYATTDTVTTFGTKGEERTAIRIGYLSFRCQNTECRINVYKSFARSNGAEYYSLWFTDLTTGDETYGVGRYIDFEPEADTAHVYTLDFNMAYSPYCSYSATYSCAIPTPDNHLNIAIRAGEKKFHD